MRSKSFLLFLAHVLGLIAPNVSIASGFSGVVTITQIHIEQASLTFIATTPSIANPDSCGNASNVLVNASDPLHSQLMSQITTAAAARKTVNFYLTGCAETPWGYIMPVGNIVFVNY